MASGTAFTYLCDIFIPQITLRLLDCIEQLAEVEPGMQVGGLELQVGLVLNLGTVAYSDGGY